MHPPFLISFAILRFLCLFSSCIYRWQSFRKRLLELFKEELYPGWKISISLSFCTAYAGASASQPMRSSADAPLQHVRRFCHCDIFAAEAFDHDHSSLPPSLFLKWKGRSVSVPPHPQNKLTQLCVERNIFRPNLRYGSFVILWD